MARLYGLHLQGFDQTDWQALLPRLSPARQQRVLACRREDDRLRAAGVGWLLQYAMAQAGVPHDAPLEKTPLGKPCFPDFPHVQFSLSHAGAWAVCAVSPQPVGVDVEMPRCTMAIARRFFPAEELAALENLPEPERRDQLNRLWTAREAFLKALGCGLTVPLDSFSIRLHHGGAALEQSLSPLPYLLHEYPLDTGRICLCTTDEKPELEILDKKSVDIR